MTENVAVDEELLKKAFDFGKQLLKFEAEKNPAARSIVWAQWEVFVMGVKDPAIRRKIANEMRRGLKNKK